MTADGCLTVNYIIILCGSYNKYMLTLFPQKLTTEEIWFQYAPVTSQH